MAKQPYQTKQEVTPTVTSEGTTEMTTEEVTVTEAPTEEVAAVVETVKAEEPVVAAPVVVATPAVSGTVVKTDTQSTGSDFSSLVSQMKKSGTLAERTFIVQMEQYIDLMKPGKPVTAEVGARTQTALWRTILGVIERSGEEFQKLFNLLLAYFEEYKNDVFHERYIFRFSEMINMPPEELAAYQRIINLIKVTCSPLGRNQSLKQVDLNRTLKDGFTEQGRQKVLAFYNR